MPGDKVCFFFESDFWWKSLKKMVKRNKWKKNFPPPLFYLKTNTYDAYKSNFIKIAQKMLTWTFTCIHGFQIGQRDLSLSSQMFGIYNLPSPFDRVERWEERWSWAESWSPAPWCCWTWFRSRPSWSRGGRTSWSRYSWS